MGNYVSTTNACKLCTPLGACIAFKGVEGAVPYLHGSQGCATYMRRYIISHFREPIDVASSALGEKQAIYGGGPSLKQGLANVVCKYNPKLVGVATTCLTETIGDDVPMILSEVAQEWDNGLPLPVLVNVSTPSYQGSHIEGYQATVRAIVDQLAKEGGETVKGNINLLPNLVSASDLRYLREVTRDFDLKATMVPDYSDTLDGPAKDVYEPIAAGGTPIGDIETMGLSAATIELGHTLKDTNSAGAVLSKRFGSPTYNLGLPIGLRESDSFFNALSEISSMPIPAAHEAERGRLVDAYVDGHKYVFGKRAVVYGEPDLVISLVSFLAEVGVQPVLAATGAKVKNFAESIRQVTVGVTAEPVVTIDNIDFYEIGEQAKALKPDLLIGNSKGFKIAREWRVPLMRVGFPVHDRFGGQRLLHLGYRGTQRIYDELVNTMLEVKQDSSPVGYGYL